MSKIRIGDWIKSSGWCKCAQVDRETLEDWLEDTHTSCGSNNEGYTHFYNHHPKKTAEHNCKKHPHYSGIRVPKCHDCFRAFVKTQGTYEASRKEPELFRKLFK